MSDYLIDFHAAIEAMSRISDCICEAEAVDALCELPTVDAVPVDFLKAISSRMYGKERFFRQTNGTWYDREQADYISLEEMMDRIYQQIVELDEGKKDFPEGFFEKPRRQATEEKGFDEKTCIPVTIKLYRHGKWEMKPDPFRFFDEIPVCSECGCTTKMREKTLYCPHCGARMDEG